MKRSGAIAIGLLACASTESRRESANALAGADAAVDAPSPVRETFVFPRAATSGGAVIAHPRLVAITFAGDPLAASIASFNQKLQSSSYVSDVGSEYGVGAVTSVKHVERSDAPLAVIDDVAIRAWLASALGPSKLLGPADPDTLYQIYFPPETTVTYAGKTGCNGFNAYHGELDAAGTRVGFATLPRCTSTDPLLPTQDLLTKSASHEILEWATDPFPMTDRAWHSVVPDSAAWALAFSAELVDLCDGRTTHSRPPDLGFVVSGMWSNARSSAGQHPCRPMPSPVFATLIPRVSDVVQLPATLLNEVRPPANGVPAVIVPPGKSVTVSAHLYSDTNDPSTWNVTAVEPLETGLSLSLDRATGVIGDDVTLKITAPAYFDTPTFVVLYVAGAASNQRYTRWPFIVSPSASF